MKKIIYLFLAGVSVLGVSCNDAIDITQPGQLEVENAFRTVADLQLALNTVYARMSPESEIEFNSIFTDEVKIGFQNGGQGLIGGEFGFLLNSASNAPLQIWANNYRVINMANRVIEAAALIQPEPADQVSYDHILGQTYALRAYANHQMLAYFSEDLTNNNSLGIPLLDFVPPSNIQLPRNTTGEIYDFIEDDLVLASALLAPAVNNASLVNPRFVHALRARMYLYRENYALAQSNADILINEMLLANTTQYSAIWGDIPIPANVELIFKHRRVDTRPATFRIGGIWASVDATINGSPFYEVGKSLRDILDEDDVRYDVIIHPSSASSPNPDAIIYPVGKYPGNTLGFPRLNDIKIFRLSEMYLIKAEALASTGSLNGPTNSVASVLKEIRDARFGSAQPLPVYESAQEAWNDILNERRIELAFEGHRYLDVKRIGVRANQGFQRAPEDCAVNGECFLAPTDYRVRSLPIPISEIAANPAISGQQNPGYSE